MRAPLDGLDPEVATEILEARNGDPDERGWGVAVGGSIPAAIESLERSVSRSARTAPVLLAFDDIQWADEPSLLAWHRLGRLARRAPLLLVSACRPVPVRPIVAALRRAAVAGGATVLPLGPLADGEVASLVADVAGAAPGPRLRGALAQAGGNPRFARDIFDVLVRGGQVRAAAGTAELIGPEDEPPAGLGEAIGHRLDYLSLEALPVLRVAAVLGTEFSVYDLATVVGCPAGALLAVLDEATAAGVLGDVGDRLRFRHGVVRQAFYETTPLSARSALHRQVARALMETGQPGERVAAHLAAVPDTVDDWAVDWLAEQAAALADRAPDLAARLLPAAAQSCPAADHRREPLVRGLARALYRLNRLDEAEVVARHAGAVATDPARAAETAWLLASILLAAGRYVDALQVLDGSLVRADVPALWRARLLAWRAKVLPYAGRPEVAEAAARRALADGEALADRVTIGHALHTLHLLAGHQAGIGYADRALEVIGDLAETTDLRVALLTDRAYNLEALGASERAQASMRAALLLAERFGPARFPEVRVRTADWCIEQGRWDDAWAELEPLTGDVGLVERLIRLGGLAFIAAHRDDRAAAGQLLAAAAKLPRIMGYLQGRATLLYLARAVDAEQRRGPDGALATLADTVAPDRGRELRERHRWLPDLVRLALAAGDRSLARDAVAAAEADAVAEPLPRRVVSARRARAVLAGDVGALLELAGDRRVAAAPLTLGQTCEEAAALLAQAGDVAGARAALTDAVRAYLDLGAGWDVRRADARLRRYGVRRGPRTVRRRPTAGWEALTPTEVRVSALVAQGRSNPEIAAAMLLSRRTVQAHVSNILAKLGFASRLEIAREVVRRMPPP